MKKKINNKIAIIVPAYNESKRIGSLLEQLEIVGYPVVVVDDGSKDKTFEVVKQFDVVVLRHSMNLGKGAALKTGCLKAFELGAEAIIMMDSDGQHRVEDLPEFINELATKKYEVIFGSRNLRMGMPLVRFVGNKLASALISILFGIYISDLVCGYRAVTKKAFEKMNCQSSGYAIETEMVIKTAKCKLKYCEVPVGTVYYDKFKGVTILDAVNILFSVLKWRIIG